MSKRVAALVLLVRGVALAQAAVAPAVNLPVVSITGAAPRLPLNLSGRLNVAQVNPADELGGPIRGARAYTHFNPGIGLTYTLASWAMAYAGYSEANRAPTPAELSCADPASPCTLANFFVGETLRQGVEVFGLVENLLDAKYETYGTFPDAASVRIAQAPGASNTRSLSPAAPVAGHGGVHVSF